MKTVNFDDKTKFVRHWFKWYRVSRSGARWEVLDPIVKLGRPPRDILESPLSKKQARQKLESIA